ncbi:MAG: outer membrane protein transport protein [Planctomycetaceae bacterium]|nr:outer membrane protein transport protein [Planctomycetales bacterium]MCB9927495.1 outer membrane protein transport protein [Planctomycetaceae bacterium]
MDSVRTRVLIITIAAISSLAADRLSAQIGHVIDAVGPINQSMGGAGTALPLDSMGALHWNPASITGLSSELGFGFAAFAPQTELSSRLEAGAFGPGIPATAMEGTTSSDTDISPIPSLGFVCSPEGSDWSYGLGGFAIGGFGVDFPASTTNPILTPQPANGGFGFGSIFSQFQLMQFAPTVAYRWSDRVSLGFAPTINWSTLAISPFSATTPNGNGTYPSAAQTDAAWGLGYQIGVYYEDPCSGWHAGMSYKSTQWFQSYKFNSQDHLGAPRQLVFEMDYPSILSLGLGYTGFDRLSLAADVRYIDYENTKGFQAAGFDGTGAVTGFGWNSIWSFSVGGQFMVTDCLA